MNHPAPTVQPAAPQDRLPLVRMLELYQHDLSDLWDQDLDVHGEFGYALDRFFAPGDDRAYVFRVAGQLAGFALVDRRIRLPEGDWWMDQFFVMKKYRRCGIGRQAAQQVLLRHPGRWQVGQMPGNHAALAFWRAVAGGLCPQGFDEQVLAHGPWQGSIQRLGISLPATAGETAPAGGGAAPAA